MGVSVSIVIWGNFTADRFKVYREGFIMSLPNPILHNITATNFYVMASISNCPPKSRLFSKLL